MDSKIFTQVFILKHIRVFTITILFTLLTSCSSLNFAAVTPTLTPTNTLEPSPTLTPTNTVEPTVTLTETPNPTPTTMPTIEPMLAVAQTSVTFRSRPGKGGDNVGGVYGNQTVRVIARNVASTWFYILAPDVPGGTAWVLASGFELKGDLTQLPIIAFAPNSQIPTMLPPLIHVLSGPPLPLNAAAPGAITATIDQLANVRVGPGVGYMEMGTLNPGTVIVLTGHLNNNVWLQIEYPSGLDGRGWVLGELVKFKGDYGALTPYNALATPIDNTVQEELLTDTPSAPETPVDTPIPPTATKDLPYGMTLAQINARSGPASSYQAYGLIEKNQRVNILGQTLNGYWIQIEYPAAPTGVAWVSSQFIKLMSNITNLPYFDNSGSPLPKP